MLERTAVIGLGITGRAVADALLARGIEVIAHDDRPGDAVTAWSTATGVPVTTPTDDELRASITAVDAVLPAPGIPDHHPLFAIATAVGTPILSEFDLAHMWDDRPAIAVTGTDGKTTVVTLIERMLNRSGVATIAVGNTDVPWIAAIDDPTWQRFVVEASSFRLDHSRCFSPAVAAWLNFGPDHLDAHASLERYEQAKASIWRQLGTSALALANDDDAVVMRHAATMASGRLETFGLGRASDHGVVDGVLTIRGHAMLPVGDLRRSLPHDIENALVAAAAATDQGAELHACAEVLREFAGLPHRAEFVAEIDGVRWINDSKATTPHATDAALRGLDSVVLMLGGRDKGLDLASLAVHTSRLRHVIALGEAAPLVEAAFDGRTPTTRAGSMEQAVAIARSVAELGDVVLLSPACASFDWYANYRARGDHFRALVERLLEAYNNRPNRGRGRS